MQNNRSSITRVTILSIAILAPVFFLHCSQHEKMIGRYQGIAESQNDPIPVTLELQANGKGLWSIETDNAPFRWNLHQGRLRLHTSSGGVIEGTIHGTTIQIALPGMGNILFKPIN